MGEPPGDGSAPGWLAQTRRARSTFTPEGPELESEALKETIDEEIERHEEPFLRWIALATAILATLAALASLKAGATVNEGLILKTRGDAPAGASLRPVGLLPQRLKGSKAAGYRLKGCRLMS